MNPKCFLLNNFLPTGELIVRSAQKPQVSNRGKDACKELKSLVEDGHAALYDLRSRNAEQAFSKALTLVETITPEVILPPKHSQVYMEILRV